MRFHPPCVYTPGTVIAGCYEVVQFLGIGSSGFVYHCRHRELNNYPVAMKILTVESEAQIERFRREILATYHVNHPNVIRPYELVTTNDVVAITMEYAAGESLADRIAREGRLPIGLVTDIISAVASGLHAIHEAGIIHRDLKPGNILTTAEGNVKIADFGVAKLDRSSKVSAKGLLGTVEYLSPEYVQYGAVDRRSDIYSLGVMAYEMITGRLPFQGDSLARTICMRVTDDPQPIATLRPECPPSLAAIVHKAMAGDPRKRYQNAAVLARDIEHFRSHLSKKAVIEQTSKAAREPIASRLKEMQLRRSRARLPRFGAPYQGSSRNFVVNAFAASSLLIWMATVGAWFYYGNRATLLDGVRSAVPETPYQSAKRLGLR